MVKRRGRTLHVGRSIDRLREQKPGGAFVKRWAWGHAAASLGLEIGRRGYHRAVATHLFSLPLPDPGTASAKVEAGDDKQASGAAGDRCEGGSFRSSATTRPRGDCEERRRVFPSGFPRHVEDFGPSHIFTVIPTAGGAASAAAAQPRIETAGGAVVRDLRVLRGSTRGGTGYHAHEMRCFRFCA